MMVRMSALEDPISAPGIVLVNDDEIQRTAYALWLIHAGYTVESFGKASDAYARLAASPLPQLIITDLFMPDIDGWKFCRMLRSSEYGGLRDVPIMVASSTYSGADVADICAQLGANYFLSLPVPRDVFIAAVNSLLEDRIPADHSTALLLAGDRESSGPLEKAFLGNGYAVSLASTFEDALRAISSERFDAIIATDSIPGWRNWDFLDAAACSQDSSVLIFCTDDPDPELAVQSVQRGASAYIRAPFLPEYVVDLCRKARRERSLLRVEHLLELRTKELRRSEARFRLMCREMRHRIKNNLATVNALVGLQAEQSHGTECAAYAQMLQGRIHSIAALYDNIDYAESLDTVFLDRYLGTIIDSLSVMFGYENTGCFARHKLESIEIDSERATAIGLIATEFLTNANKYGGRSGYSPAVEVHAYKSVDYLYLDVENSLSQAPSRDRVSSSGIGLELVELLAEQISGHTACEQSETSIKFRLAAPL